MKFYTKEKCTFSKFMSYLQAPTLDLEGCEIWFPDTVFFIEGEYCKPDYIGRTDKDGKFTTVK